jgi:hypothetical protein
MKRILNLVAALPLILVAGPLQAAQGHLSQDITNHVVLHFQDTSLSFCNPLKRLYPNGEEVNFQLDEGALLVVTDVFWRVEPVGFSLRGIFVELKLIDKDDRPKIADPSVYRSRTVTIVDLNDDVSGSDHLTTGFVVGPKAKVCAVSNRLGTYSVILHGYLTKGKGSPILFRGPARPLFPSEID